ncbi:MAG TPA: hypothetical protein DCO71_02825 [Gammaproteobacteria bacterium]|nr:hypothetical protein [Gammaproteobacteria bacterium]
MIMHRYALLLCAALGLSACQSGFQVSTGDGNFEKLSATGFALHQDVRIPPRQAHVSFQRGAREPGAGEYAPHCELAVSRVLEAAQTVRAGVFEITGVHGVTHYVRRRNQGIQLAAADGFQLVADDDTLMADDTGEWIMLAYQFALHSDGQPDVQYLLCGGAYGFPYYARYPDLEDIRLALGEVGSLTFR